MTTALEAKLLPKAHAAVKKYGTTAAFTLYPSAVTNTDDSEVTLGAPQVHTVCITPPEAIETEFAPDGSAIEEEAIKFFVSSGALTSEAIAFTPAIGQSVTVRGRAYRVRKVNAVASGDQIALYDVEARA